MAYGIVHVFPGGTKEQYDASIAAVHPSDGSLPAVRSSTPRARARRAGRSRPFTTRRRAGRRSATAPSCLTCSRASRADSHRPRRRRPSTWTRWCRNGAEYPFDQAGRCIAGHARSSEEIAPAPAPGRPHRATRQRRARGAEIAATISTATAAGLSTNHRPAVAATNVPEPQITAEACFGVAPLPMRRATGCIRRLYLRHRPGWSAG